MAVNKSKLGNQAGVNYSEDEDEVVLVGGNANTRKKTSRTSATPQKQKKEADGDFDVSSAVEALSDEELFKQLVDFGEEMGPIVDSTRMLYRRRLAKLLLESGQEKSNEGQSNANGVNTSEAYSADEDDDNSVESQNGTSDPDQEDEKEYNRVSERKSTPSRRVSNRSSNIKEVAKELRASADRFVPTARATIHSYTVHERRTRSIVENNKGIISTNTSYERETSSSERSNKSNINTNRAKIFSVCVKLLLAIVVFGLVAYAYLSMGRGVSPEFDQAIDHVATSSYRILSHQPSVKEEDEQPSIANV